MNAPGTIRALRRGLEVLELLQGRTGVSLTELHRLTGLPMATLLRILRTLEEADFVRRGLGDGLYHASTRMQRVGRKIGEDERLIEAGAPVLGELCTKIAWASDIAVFDGLGMRIKETSRLQSPFSLDRDVIDRRVVVTLSALGRAYLTAVGETERTEILTDLLKSPDPRDAIIQDPAKFKAMLRETRAQGYGIRDKNAVQDGLNAIAVAISGDGKVLGSISLIWVAAAMTVDQIVEQHLESLNDAAKKIGQRYEALSGA